MPDLTDQSYLLNEQYRDASNLNARIRLHQLYSANPRGMHDWIFDKLLELQGLGRTRSSGSGVRAGTIVVG